MVNVAILGFGVVGSGVMEVLTTHTESIQKRAKESSGRYSSGVWQPRMVGPTAMASRPGSASENRPHSRPACSASILSSVPNRS